MSWPAEPERLVIPSISNSCLSHCPTHSPLWLSELFARHMRVDPRDLDPPDLVTSRAELQEPRRPGEPGAPELIKTASFSPRQALGRASRRALGPGRDAAQDLTSSLIGASNGHRLSRHAPIDQLNRPGPASNWRGRPCNLGLIQRRKK